MRLFFAAWPPPTAARALEAWAASLGGRPTPAQKIHLTLAFLGDAQPPAALEAARGVRGAPHRLPIEIARHWRHNRVLWVGPRNTPAELVNLVEALHGALRANGFSLEARPFAAHVTLMRTPRAPRPLPPPPALDWPIEEFTLVRSSLSGSGSKYDVLERFALGGG